MLLQLGVLRWEGPPHVQSVTFDPTYAQGIRSFPIRESSTRPPSTQVACLLSLAIPFVAQRSNAQLREGQICRQYHHGGLC